MRTSVPRPLSDWRKQYKVHPAADVFPMMSDDELAKLGEDIKANGLVTPVMLWYPPDNNEKVLLDGRNRLEAMERLGLVLHHTDENDVIDDDPVAHIISLNIHRRHSPSNNKPI